jgi:hypothetical protein
MTEKEKFRGIIRESFLNAFPNPDRKGCPSDEMLRKLAQDRLPLTHAAAVHVSSCSPCCKELLELQTAWDHSRRRSRIKMIAATAAVITIGLIGGIWIQHTRSDDRSRMPEVSQIADLWSWPTSRGDEDYQRSLTLRTAVIVNLTIVLPRGSGGGLYRIAVTKDRTGSHPIANTAARSSVLSQAPFKYRLIATLDLRSAPPGTYFLQITDPTNLTYYYPLQIT